MNHSLEVFCRVVLLAMVGYSLTASGQTVSSGSVDRERAGLAGAVTRTPQFEANTAAAVLNKRVENVEWLETPFEEVINWLKTEGEDRISVVPRWQQLSIEGVDPDTLVTLQLSYTTVAEVLAEALDNISPDGELAFHAIGNTLKISTKADFDRKLYIRVYDVTDVLFRVEDMGEDAPLIDLQRTTGGGGGGGGGSGQSVFSGSSSKAARGRGGEQAEQEYLDRLERLAENIQAIIAPDTWDTGQVGGRGRIRAINRSLVVYNTIEVHEIITGYFAFGE